MTGPAHRNHDGALPHDGEQGTRRLAAVLLVAGVVVSFGSGTLHPGGADPNDHAAAFAEYARSDLWIGVHLGQFVGMAALVAGLLALGSVAGAGSGWPAGAARLGSWAAAAALALYGYLMGLSGTAYLAQGWIIGAQGFAASNALPTLAGIVLTLVWTLWLLASSLRRS